jgi:hypothetical protein
MQVRMKKVKTVARRALSMKKTTSPMTLKDLDARSTKRSLGTAEGTTENTADV